MRDHGLKFALKIWSTDTHLIKEAEKLVKDGLFCLVEVLVVPGSDISPFESADFPISLHCAHEKFGMNPGDASKDIFNRKIVDEAIKWGETFNSTTIIIHPGHGSLETSANFLASIDYRWLAVENMPFVGLNGERMLGHDRKEMKLLVGNRHVFCLDVAHAVKASISRRGHASHWDLSDLACLYDNKYPACIHVSDGHTESEFDEHLRIGEGNFDFMDMKHYGMFQDGDPTPLTLETTRRGTNFDDDVQSRKRLIEMLSRW